MLGELWISFLITTTRVRSIIKRGHAPRHNNTLLLYIPQLYDALVFR